MLLNGNKVFKDLGAEKWYVLPYCLNDSSSNLSSSIRGFQRVSEPRFPLKPSENFISSKILWRFLFEVMTKRTIA